jgi:hypothetical protein
MKWLKKYGTTHLGKWLQGRHLNTGPVEYEQGRTCFVAELHQV